MDFFYQYKSLVQKNSVSMHIIIFDFDSKNIEIFNDK